MCRYRAEKWKDIFHSLDFNLAELGVRNTVFPKIQGNKMWYTRCNKENKNNIEKNYHYYTKYIGSGNT